MALGEIGAREVATVTEVVATQVEKVKVCTGLCCLGEGVRFERAGGGGAVVEVAVVAEVTAEAAEATGCREVEVNWRGAGISSTLELS